MDRISDLPLSIIETILCLLPYQDVVRTSILSKEWRYHWTKIPKIVVIVGTCQATTLKRKRKQDQKQNMIKKSKLLFDICQTLSMHEGPIHEFNLSLNNQGDNVGEIDSILSHLSRKNTVKKMILLDFDHARWFFSLPVSLLSMSQLTYLYVKNWILSDEPTSSRPKHGTSGVSRKPEKEKETSSGLGSLTSLYVHRSFFDFRTLLHLLSKCPLLKTLALTDNHMVSLFSHGPTITNLFQCLPVIENLTLCCSIIESLPLDSLAKDVPIALVHLKHLCIESIYFNHYYGLRITSLFIKSSPNLEKLTVKIKDNRRRGGILSFSRVLEYYRDIWMEHLSELEITYISNEQTELNIVKLILMRSPALKKLRIFISKSYKDEEMQISETLLSAPHASPVVELIVEKEPF